MSAKQETNGTWSSKFRYTDWEGVSRQKHARGFPTKEAAEEFEEIFKQKCSTRSGILFESYAEKYLEDIRPRVRESTMRTKTMMVRERIAPLFVGKMLCEITMLDCLHAKADLETMRQKDGKPYSQSYLRRIDEQISSMFNHAVRNYELPASPCAKLKQIGSNKSANMQIWTKRELNKFLDAIANKPRAFYAILTLFWTGLREGELLALTPADFDFDKCMLTINKTFHVFNGEEVVGPPKTEQSYRTISVPKFLCIELKQYIEMTLKIEPNERIFQGVSRSFLYREMRRGCAASGVKVIRIHDLRHSHVSLLIHMGYSVITIAQRMGHKSTDITYRYAHLFPSVQSEMAEALQEMQANRNV